MDDDGDVEENDTVNVGGWDGGRREVLQRW